MNVVEATLPTALEDMSDIKRQYKVDEVEFNKAIEFGLAMTSFTALKDAYVSIFPESQNPRKDASRYIKRKYVTEVVKRLQASNYLLFSDVRNKVIQEMGQVALDRGAGRQQVEAAKVFLEHTKMPENITLDVDIDISDDAKEAMNAFLGTMQMISQGKVGMIGKDGKITDVEVCE